MHSCNKIHHTKPGLNNRAGVNKAGEGISENLLKIRALKAQCVNFTWGVSGSVEIYFISCTVSEISGASLY